MQQGSGRNPYSWFRERKRDAALVELAEDGLEAPSQAEIKEKFKAMWETCSDTDKV